jgi:hypothetical protein
MRKTIKRISNNRKKNRRGGIGTIKNLVNSVPLKQLAKTAFQNFAGHPTRAMKTHHSIDTASTRIPRPYSRSKSIITTN